MQSKREFVLVLVFAGTLAIVAVTFAWTHLSREMERQRTLLKQKEGQLREAQIWLNEEKTWKARGEWMKNHPPPAHAGSETDADFVQEVQASLGRSGIEIVEQRIRETQMTGSFVGVGLDLVLSAPLENLVRWLFEAQRFDAFRVIDRIKLKSDADDSKIRAEISLVQLYCKSSKSP